MPTPTGSPRPPRPTTRDGFSILIICALPLEANAVLALFDHHWDNDGPPFDKAPGDPNAYSTGTIGRHNVVVAHMSGMGKVNSAAVANSCRMSFINIKLALLVGITGIVPFDADGKDIFLGDVIISEGVIQYDLGRQHEDRFTRKNTLLDSLGRPNAEIRAILAKLKGLRSRRSLCADMAGYLDTLRLDPLLAAEHPGIEYDMLFEANHQRLCENETGHSAGHGGNLVQRRRPKDTTDLQPAIHFGLIGSGDLVMRSGKHRDDIAREEGVIAFESESAGIWDTYPCVVIKGGCNYADGHENKRFQIYSAATAAACMKAFLRHWVPSQTPQLEQVPPQMAMGTYGIVAISTMERIHDTIEC